VRILLLDEHTVAIAELDAREKVVTVVRINALGPRPAPAWTSSAASRRARWPSCSWRWATPGALPRVALVRITAPPRCRRPRERDRASLSATASTVAATDGFLTTVLHRMAVTQRRCDPRAQKLFEDARRGHTKKEAMPSSSAT
jgi:hypothetical protein